MSKKIEQHLKSITPEKLDDFRHEAFFPMASCNGNCSIGVNGKGMYAVKYNNKTYLFLSAGAAVERYKDCAVDNITGTVTPQY